MNNVKDLCDYHSAKMTMNSEEFLRNSPIQKLNMSNFLSKRYKRFVNSHLHGLYRKTKYNSYSLNMNTSFYNKSYIMRDSAETYRLGKSRSVDNFN